jgi:hypothetical protein
MGTRAVYTFIDEFDRHSVFKHWDGYPRSACQCIVNALALAWPLPRFEADEFAAAFVAANKKGAGDIRLTSGPEVHGDLAFTYETSCQGGRLHVRINQAGYYSRDFNQSEFRPIFIGSLDDAQHFSETYK